MEYRHSVPLPPEMYEGKVPTVFLPRVHIQAEIADKACWMIRDEMIAAGCNDEVAQIPGNIDLISGNLIAVGFPEALPDRLEVVSMGMEWAFMIDGKIFCTQSHLQS
jgi:ophiobolin F synthase